jgi:hypothetical protein
MARPWPLTVGKGRGLRMQGQSPTVLRRRSERKGAGITCTSSAGSLNGESCSRGSSREVDRFANRHNSFFFTGLRAQLLASSSPWAAAPRPARRALLPPAPAVTWWAVLGAWGPSAHPVSDQLLHQGCLLGRVPLPCPFPAPHLIQGGVAVRRVQQLRLLPVLGRKQRKLLRPVQLQLVARGTVLRAQGRA